MIAFPRVNPGNRIRLLLWPAGPDDGMRGPAARRPPASAACGGIVGPSLTSRRAGCIGARDSAACLMAPHIELSRSRTIQQSVDQLAAKGSVKEGAEGFVIEARLEGASGRDLNRTLLSALRKVQRKAALRSERTSSDGTTKRFFDYVLKKTTRNRPVAVRQLWADFLAWLKTPVAKRTVPSGGAAR